MMPVKFMHIFYLNKPTSLDKDNQFFRWKLLIGKLNKKQSTSWIHSAAGNPVLLFCIFIKYLLSSRRHCSPIRRHQRLSLISFLHISSSDLNTLIWSNVILIYHFSAQGKISEAWGCLRSSWTQRQTLGTLPVQSISPTPQSAQAGAACFFVRRYKTTSTFPVDRKRGHKLVNRSDVSLSFFFPFKSVFVWRWLVDAQSRCVCGLSGGADFKGRQRSVTVNAAGVWASVLDTATGRVSAASQ